jgi:hypothetical protein
MNATRRTSHVCLSLATSTAKGEQETARFTPDASRSLGPMSTGSITTAMALAASSRNTVVHVKRRFMRAGARHVPAPSRARSSLTRRALPRRWRKRPARARTFWVLG